MACVSVEGWDAIVADVHARVDAIRKRKGLAPYRWEQRAGISHEELEARIAGEQAAQRTRRCACGCGWDLSRVRSRSGYKRGHKPRPMVTREGLEEVCVSR